MNKNIKKSIMKILIICVVIIMIFSSYVYGQTKVNTDSLDKLVDWIAVWSGKIGLIVAFFGGIQTALAIRNEDSDGKVRGIKTLVSGFMVFALSNSLDLFGL